MSDDRSRGALFTFGRKAALDQKQFELLARFMDAPSHGAFGTTKHLTRLSVTQAIHPDQDQRRAQRIAQSVHAFTQRATELAVLAVAERVRAADARFHE